MLTPSEHYAEADRLLALVENREVTPPFVDTMLKRAEVHAMLAGCCPDWHGDDPGDDPDDWAVRLGPNGYVNAPRVETRTATNERL